MQVMRQWKIYKYKNLLRLILLIVSGIIFLIPLSKCVSTGDGAELTSSAIVLGIPHPPGYPLWNLLGRISVVLFGPEGTNYLSYFTGILFIILLFEILLILTEDMSISFIISLITCFYPSILNYSTITEVYSLSFLFFIFNIYFYLKKNNSILSYISGLNFFVHPVLIMLTFINLVFLIKNKRFNFFYFLLGTSIILFIPIRATHKPVLNWLGEPEFNNLIKLLTRYDYYTFGEKVKWDFSILFKEIIIYFKIILKDLPLLFLSLYGFYFLKNNYLRSVYIVFSIPLAIIIHYPASYESTFVNEVFFTFNIIAFLIFIPFLLLKLKRFKYLILLFIFLNFLSFDLKDGIFRKDKTGEVFLKEAEKFIEDGDVILTDGDTYTFLLLYQSLKTNRFKIRNDALRINEHLIPTISSHPNNDFSYVYGLFYSNEKKDKIWDKTKYPDLRNYYPDVDVKVITVTRWIENNPYDRSSKRLLDMISKEQKLFPLHVHQIGEGFIKAEHYKNGFLFMKKWLKYYDNGYNYHLLYILSGDYRTKSFYLSEGLCKGFDGELLNDAGIHYMRLNMPHIAYFYFRKSVSEASMRNILIIYNKILKK